MVKKSSYEFISWGISSKIHICCVDVELVEDPSGRTDASDSQFSVDYANVNDIHMGSDTPPDKYIAIPLLQDSILALPDMITTLTLDYS